MNILHICHLHQIISSLLEVWNIYSSYSNSIQLDILYIYHLNQRFNNSMEDRYCLDLSKIQLNIMCIFLDCPLFSSMGVVSDIKILYSRRNLTGILCICHWCHLMHNWHLVLCIYCPYLNSIHRDTTYIFQWHRPSRNY